MSVRFLMTFAKVLMIAAACLGAGAAVGAGAETTQTSLVQESLVVRAQGADHRFRVEVAATAQERARGLMFRNQMAADHGMLFVFDTEGERYFWMKNTPLPLDIIFIATNGEIVSIAADTSPYSEDTIPSNGPARYVLELNAGTAAKLGFGPGDLVSSPSMGGE